MLSVCAELRYQSEVPAVRGPQVPRHTDGSAAYLSVGRVGCREGPPALSPCRRRVYSGLVPRIRAPHGVGSVSQGLGAPQSEAGRGDPAETDAVEVVGIITPSSDSGVSPTPGAGEPRPRQ